MDTRKWKRAFMGCERERRRMKRDLEATIFEMDVEAVRSDIEIQDLKFQIKRDLCTIQGQRRIISDLQKLLRDHAIDEPSGTRIASFKTCRASEDEECPLSLHPINASPPPYDPKHATIDVEPRKPHHKCAELHCGHRFNSLWLLYHFVSQNTFCCPICRVGPNDFRFERDQLPEGLIERIRSITDIQRENV